MLAPFRALKPVVDNIVSAPDQLAVSHSNDAVLANPANRLTIRGCAYTDLYTEMMRGVFDKWLNFTEETPDAKACIVIWEPRGPKQKLTEVSPDAMAFPIRTAHHSVAIQGRNLSPEFDVPTRAWTKAVVDYIRAENTKHSGTDLGYLFTMTQGDEAPETVFGANLPRLRGRSTA